MTVRLLRAAAVALALLTTAVVAPSSPASASPDRNFVTRHGTALELNGRPFRFAGTNVYWLGLDENVGGVDHPTYFRIRDAIDTAKAMGMTVIRSHMLTSTGDPKTLLPSKEAGYNEAAFRTIDYAMAYAGQVGIKLILPLTDNWAYYHGGHADFTEPYGLPESAFYTDPRVIADYQSYVSHVFNHVNTLTGKRYADDPTVLAWELGNEMEGMTPDWIATTAAAFSAGAPRQLVAAGRRFDIDPDTLAAADVDIVDVHYYPPTAARVQADAATVAAAGKVYIAGEYASTAASAALLDPLVADRNVTGMLSWSLFSHADRTGFVQHDDGFSFHYPGDDARMVAANQAQIAFARALGGSAATRPAGTPVITAIDKRGGLNVLQWRGAAGASGYRVERARSAYGPWHPAHSGLLTDNDTPWTDPVASGDTWYRVGSSEPVRVGSGETVLTDTLETFGLTAGHAGVDINPGTKGAVIRPTGAGPAWVSWHHPGTRQVRFQALAGRRPGLTVQVSADGTTWRTVPAAVNHPVSTGGADYVRVTWKGNTGLTGATFWAADPAPVTRPPAAFAVATPGPGATGVIGPSSFTWAPAAGAGYYTLRVSRRPDLRDPVITATGLDTTSYTPVQGLDPATTWYWGVRATNARGSTNTPVASFTTRALPAAPATIDDFEGYADSGALAAAYVRNTGGDPITPTLVSGAMQLEVTAGAAGYAGVTRTFATPVDLWGQQGLSFQLDRSASQAGISVQFVANGVYWEYTLPAGTPSGVVQVPFSSFTQPSWAPTGALDLRNFTQLSIYLGGSDSGRVVVDDVQAYPFRA